jgi:hypothetical protein
MRMFNRTSAGFAATLLVAFSGALPASASDCAEVILVGYVLSEGERAEVCRFAETIDRLDPLDASTTADLLREIDRTAVRERVRSHLRYEVVDRVGQLEEAVLVDWLSASGPELAAVAVAALSAREDLERDSVLALGRLVESRVASVEVRAAALELLGLRDALELAGVDVNSLAGHEDEVLAIAASFFLVHPECELGYSSQRSGGDLSLTSGWLEDSRRSVRREAALCILGRGEAHSFEAQDPVVRSAIEIVGQEMLDPRASAVIRGSAIAALANWAESSPARRLLEQMFRPRNWFFGASGQHWPIHSLAKLYQELDWQDLPWANSQFERLLSSENDLARLPGGDYVMWLLRDDDSDFFSSSPPSPQ